ncbi:hypothetical protein [Paenibacillus sp. BC26]|uniref:hypothetical protein n=1 Tax=Paenibacillus sp. BC26 TaxID=1881032 RepID=UPI0008EFB9D1|nr:hypothetical protein [Paenibacillus sp. BC26]SFS75928.1 hypothetical protein SAMN05428962_2685 [Paenibacillus sp. BC26]
MQKQTRRIILLLTAVSIASIGIAVWQNYELRLEHKREERHLSRMAHRGAYFIYLTQQQINTVNKENSWDNKETRDSFRALLARADESLIGTNWTLSDFSSQASSNMNDIYFWFTDWWIEAVDILNKAGPLSKEDKTRISELSNIVSKVDGFYVSTPSYYDWDGISDQLASLHEEWKKAK